VNGNQRKREKGESSKNSFTLEKGVDLSQGEQKKMNVERRKRVARD
jgi:hypothetical protein